SFFFFHRHRHPPDLPSFPTRRSSDLELIAARAAAGTPILGICLGMQLLFESSSELGGASGLGLLAGTVAELQAPGLKVPHIGWEDRKSTRLNSSHSQISYAVFCLKKK